jgi:hypothetical protein
MGKRIQKHSDGLYHANGSTFEELIGTRAKVFHGTAYKTTGGLTKSDLEQNKKTGRIVSKRKAADARKTRRLEKAGYKPVKGKFVVMRKHTKSSKKKSSRTK